MAKAIRYAKALDCSLINCLVGLRPPGVSESRVRDVLASNLRFAADALGQEGIRLLIESLNTRDMPGFYLSRTADILALIQEISHSNNEPPCSKLQGIVKFIISMMSTTCK